MKNTRVAAVWVVSAGLLVVLPDFLPSPPPGGWQAWWSWSLADPERALVLAAGVLAFCFTAWLFLLTSLTLDAAARDPSGRAARRVAEWITPRFARGLLQFLLGAAVAVGPAAPALALAPRGAVVTTSAPALSPVPAPIVAPPDVPPLLLLDRPGTSSASAAPRRADQPHPRPHPQPQPQRQAAPTSTSLPTHVVTAGDTLWDLAAHQLPAGSSPASITRGWQQWYALNQGSIGSDPGLLLIGERLVIPPVTS